MLNYNKNGLINECMAQYYETFARTLDTADYVPQKYNERINKYIFKNMKRQFKKIDGEDKFYQRLQKMLDKERKREDLRVVKAEVKKQKALRRRAIKKAREKARAQKKLLKESKK